MKPLVSVLLLTYNHRQYITEAIESVLMQKTNFLFELLIGDDCSTDGTCEIVNKYLIQYPDVIKVIRSENNVGAILNEKRLMESAQGKYVAFLEGDDYWTNKCKLQKQCDFLENNPDVGLVHGDVNHYIEADGKMIVAYNKINNIKIPNGQIFNELIIPSHIIKTMTVCFRKEIILKHFDYDIPIKRDWQLTDLPLWLDISYHSKIYYFDEVFATYRLINESASRSQSPLKKLRFHQSVFDVFDFYVDKYTCNTEILRKITNYKFKNALKFSLIFKDLTILKAIFQNQSNLAHNLTTNNFVIYKLIQNKFIFLILSNLFSKKHEA